MRRSLLLPPLLAMLAMLAMLAPASAHACAVVSDHRQTWTENLAQARQTIERAAAIIDGEVIRPFVEGGPPALVRAHRVLKGPQQADFPIGWSGSCGIALTDRGERARMILTGGPDLYYLEIDQSNARLEDALLRSDRRRDWPFVQGTAPAP